jgi:hypothetical protein
LSVCYGKAEIVVEMREKEKVIRAESDKIRKVAAYRTAMRKKYQHASRYPWLPVAPDPPEPK